MISSEAKIWYSFFRAATDTATRLRGLLLAERDPDAVRRIWEGVEAANERAASAWRGYVAAR
jgi:hypothetical protein